MTKFDVDKNGLELPQSERHSIDGTSLLLRGRLIVRLLHLVGRQGDNHRLCVARQWRPFEKKVTMVSGSH